MGASEGEPEGAGRAGGGGDDGRLWEAFRELVEARGRTAAADVLGVNYRTVVANLEAGRLSRRMRMAVQRFERAEAEEPESPEPAEAPESGETAEAVEPGETTQPVDQSVEALVAEVRQLRETVEAQAGQLEEMGRRVAQLEEARKGPESEPGPAVEAGAGEAWRPPRRAHDMPDAGVVTLEAQPDEEHAFGPAAGFVAEWRGLRTGGVARGSRVDRLKAEERRWELEVMLIGKYGLTLPPEKEPLQGARRDDHLRWRKEAWEEARRKRVRAERWRAMLTLGLWRG